MKLKLLWLYFKRAYLWAGILAAVIWTAFTSYIINVREQFTVIQPNLLLARLELAYFGILLVYVFYYAFAEGSKEAFKQEIKIKEDENKAN